MGSRVLITDSAELLTPAVARLQDAGFDVDVLPDGVSAQQAAAAGSRAEALIVGLHRFGPDELALLERAGLIVRAGVGYDVIDVPAATRAGIWVANVPDYCVDEVADHTVLLLLAATRRLTTLAGLWVSEGRWVVTDRLPAVHRPATQTLGIVGLGRIGSAVARRAAAFGWRIIAHDPTIAPERFDAVGATPVELDALFAQADAVTLHSPVDDTTRHLVNAERLGMARDGLVLVNTSRGGLLDLDALEAALDSGRVAFAALDVLDDEPRPDLGRPLLHRPEVLVTPHVAWYSLEARRDLALFAADEVIRFLRGERPRNLVNPEARGNPGPS